MGIEGEIHIVEGPATLTEFLEVEIGKAEEDFGLWLWLTNSNDGPPNPSFNASLHQSKNRIRVLERAKYMLQTGDDGLAFAYLQQTVRSLETLLFTHPDDLEIQDELVCLQLLEQQLLQDKALTQTS